MRFELLLSKCTSSSCTTVTLLGIMKNIYLNLYMYIFVYIFHKGWFITNKFLKFIYLTLYVQRHFYLCVFFY